MNTEKGALSKISISAEHQQISCKGNHARLHLCNYVHTLFCNESLEKKKKKGRPVQLHWDFSEQSVLQLPPPTQRTWCRLHPPGSFPPVRFHIFSPDYAIVCRGSRCPTPPSHHEATMHGSSQLQRLLGIVSTNKSPKHVVMSSPFEGVKPETGGEEGVWVHGRVLAHMYSCQWQRHLHSTNSVRKSRLLTNACTSRQDCRKGFLQRAARVTPSSPFFPQAFPISVYPRSHTQICVCAVSAGFNISAQMWLSAESGCAWDFGRNSVGWWGFPVRLLTNPHTSTEFPQMCAQSCQSFQTPAFFLSSLW